MRMMRTIALAWAFAAACTAGAQAATTSRSIPIKSPASTSVTCPLAASYTAPLAAGSKDCTISVAPAGWSSARALSGTHASSFALSGSNLVVGSTALAAGTYAVTITATP